MLEKKISDSRFLKLFKTLVKAPTITEGTIEENEQGSPQGSMLSPVLANIYLHYVIDEWFNIILKTHVKGKAELIRYADDIVFVFENIHDAERFYRALPLRLGKYGLLCTWINHN